MAPEKGTALCIGHPLAVRPEPMCKHVGVDSFELKENKKRNGLIEENREPYIVGLVSSAEGTN